MFPVEAPYRCAAGHAVYRGALPTVTFAHLRRVEVPVSDMQAIRDAILADELAALSRLPVPEAYAGLVVRKDETEMFAGLSIRDKDPRKSLHLEEVPTPELGPGEALVAVLASAINYNTVWTSIFEPLPTFGSGPTSTPPTRGSGSGSAPGSGS